MIEKFTLRLLLCGIAILACLHTGYAQSDDELTEGESAASEMPKAASVDAVAMGNNISTSLDYYTGAANVSMPVHTVSHNGIQVPISLSYRTVGVRVEDIASEVGLGWELSAGGSVKRMMMGGPDEGRMDYMVYDTTGYDSNNNPITQPRVVNPNRPQSWPYMGYYAIMDKFDWEYVKGGRPRTKTVFHEGAYKKYLKVSMSISFMDPPIFFMDPPIFGLWGNRLNDFDFQPDLYSFTIPGAAGMFVIDENMEIHTIPYQNIKIELVNGVYAADNYFRITDSNGNVYELGKGAAHKETTIMKQRYKRMKKDPDRNHTSASATWYEFKENEYDYLSAWHLSKITNFKGDEITFDYGPANDKSIEYKLDTVRVPVVDTKWHFYSNQGDAPNFRLSHPNYAPNETRTWVSKRYLKEIRWPAGKVEFSYSYRDTTSTKDLNSIAFFNSKYSNMPIFLDLEKTIRFNYRYIYSCLGYLHPKLMDIELLTPSGDTKTIARFEYAGIGFGNKQDVDHWGYYNGSDNENFWASHYFSNNFNYVGADRKPNLRYAVTNSLSRIRRITGAVTEFEYELHKKTPNSTREIGGLRIKALIEKNGPSETRTEYSYHGDTYHIYADYPQYYDLSSNSTSGEIRKDRYFAHESPFGAYFDITGSLIGYNEVTEYLPNGSSIVRRFISHNSYPDTTPITRKSVEDNVEDLEHHGEYDSPRTSRFYLRGLMTEEAYYEKDNKQDPVKRTEYIYNTNAAEKARVRALSPYPHTYNRGHSFHNAVAHYFWISQPVYLEKTIEHATKYNLRKETSFVYDEDHMVPVSTLVKFADNETIENSVKYTFDFPGTLEGKLYEDYGIVSPVTQTTYENEKVIASSLNLMGYVENLDHTRIPVPLRKYDLALRKPVDSGVTLFRTSSTSGVAMITFDPRFKSTSRNIGADQDGNILVTESLGGQISSVILGYNKTQVIAEVTNAYAANRTVNAPGEPNGYRKTQVFHTSFEDMYYETELGPGGAKTGRRVHQGSYAIDLRNMESGLYKLTYWHYVSGQGWARREGEVNITSGLPEYNINVGGGDYIDEIRLLPENARITTYTYDIGKGKTSEMDHNGFVSYWEYDELGRVVKTRDNNRKILTETEYHIDNL